MKTCSKYEQDKEDLIKKLLADNKITLDEAFILADKTWYLLPIGPGTITIPWTTSPVFPDYTPPYTITCGSTNVSVGNLPKGSSITFTKCQH